MKHDAGTQSSLISRLCLGVRRWPLRLGTLAVLASVISCQAVAPGRYDTYVGPARASASGRTSGDAPRVARPDVPETGTLDLGIQDAILLALEHNRAFKVQRLATPIRRTFEEQERAAFDPTVKGGVSIGSSTAGQASAEGIDPVHSRRAEAGAGVEKLLPSGTTVGIEGSTDISRASGSGDLASSRLGLSVTQALLRGYGSEVNYASLRQAMLGTQASQYEVRGFAEALVARVEQSYWNYSLALRQIEIFTQSLRLAEQQLAETRERIRVGRLAEIELAAAEAEVALRNEGLINARSALAKARIALIRLLNPPGPNPWDREIVLRNAPTIPETSLEEVANHVQVAERMRPDLNEARLQVKQGSLEIVKTRNGLLPKLDLFVSLGKTGYSQSFFGAAEDMDGKGYDASLGILLQYPLGNRDADARYRRSLLTHEQASEAVGNLLQLSEVDVRESYVEVNRSREQVAATAATRKLQEEMLRAETEKFQVGRSTSLLVARAQRDLLASQIEEIQAVVSYLNALVDMYRVEGSLLERRGIEAPGRAPVLLGAVPPK